MPDSLAWNDRFRIGHPMIDANHRRLFDILHAATQRERQEGAGPALNQLIDDLLDYAGAHFPREELLMRQTCYPNLDNHSRIHRSFVTQLRSIDRNAASAREGFDFLNDYLHRWVHGHILISDRKFGRFLEQGMELGAAD